MLQIVDSMGGKWQYSNPRRPKGALITLSGNSVVLDYLERGKSAAKSILPFNCSLALYENNTTAKTREEVFAKFINQCLDSNYEYVRNVEVQLYSSSYHLTLLQELQKQQ